MSDRSNVNLLEDVQRQLVKSGDGGYWSLNLAYDLCELLDRLTPKES